ncbi:hypothetical protein [Halomarina oriensis]|uniref:PIN domain-containing protein n=1 Tax=Halomarina oriensis TaxID=671145 RepID=A0A6B0GND9_9EURY|nr:hypothetical protein [Halomarina oriensis]MWG35019.1 hypothetical protein [Halomarina oriensis]
MSEPAGFVLDTNVISSFFAVDWLEALLFWDPTHDLYAPTRVWDEFSAYHDTTQPEWLTLQSVNLETVEVEAPMRLAVADWACIILAEATNCCVVTNDRAMHDAAERRGVDFQWETQYLLSTFYGCGLSKSQLDIGLPEYADDLGLNEEVVADVRDAEKPDSI